MIDLVTKNENVEMSLPRSGRLLFGLLLNAHISGLCKSIKYGRCFSRPNRSARSAGFAGILSMSLDVELMQDG